MSSFKRLSILPTILGLLIFTVVADGQTVTGSIAGTVTDSTGGVIPGAAVTISSDKSGLNRSATTNGEGRFNFAALQPGSYSIKVERPGFQVLEQTNVILSANESL